MVKIKWPEKIFNEEVLERIGDKMTHNINTVYAKIS